MRDYHSRSLGEGRVKCTLQALLGVAVDARSGLVQEQNRGISVEGTRKGNELAFANAQLVPGNHCVQTTHAALEMFQRFHAFEHFTRSLSIDRIRASDVTE